MPVLRLATGFAAVLVIALVARAEMRPPEPFAVHASRALAPTNAAARGRDVYARYGCAQCHGVDAKGGFPNLNAETDSQVPGLLFVKGGYTTAELRRKILEGTPTIGKADPQGPAPPFRMPGWSSQMTEREVTDLVAYLASLYPASAEEKWH